LKNVFKKYLVNLFDEKCSNSVICTNSKKVKEIVKNFEGVRNYVKSNPDKFFNEK